MSQLADGELLRIEVTTIDCLSVMINPSRPNLQWMAYPVDKVGDRAITRGCFVHIQWTRVGEAREDHAEDDAQLDPRIHLGGGSQGNDWFQKRQNFEDDMKGKGEEGIVHEIVRQGIRAMVPQTST